MALAEGSYFRDVNASLGNKSDQSSASASSSLTTGYRDGDYYTVSGRTNSSLSVGRIVIFSGLAMLLYWAYEKIKKGK